MFSFFLKRRCAHKAVETVYFRHLAPIVDAGPGGYCHRNVCLSCGETFDHISLNAGQKWRGQEMQLSGSLHG